MSYYYVIGTRAWTTGSANGFALQKVLTENGCKIKARLGLHEVSEDLCATDGVIVLQPYGEKEEVEQLVKSLNALDGTGRKTHRFEFEQPYVQANPEGRTSRVSFWWYC